MIVDDLVRNPDSWLTRGQAPDAIVLSTRVRLARNLRGFPFPSQARKEDRLKVCEQVRKACDAAASVPTPMFLDMGALEPMDKSVLKERRLISAELAEKGEGSGLIMAKGEQTAIMINEEDHLRLQAIAPGEDLLAVWKRIDAVDTELEDLLDYAFSARLGYLTSCPSNVGTGLRASVMMHLPGLHLIDEADAAMRGLTKIGLAVRGLFGEGSEAYGNMYQISNQVTLGRSEEDILGFLLEIVKEIAVHERNARLRLMEGRRSLVLDRVGRSFGVLANARIVTSEEMVELLSILRLGVEFGLVTGITVPSINEMLLLTQPGHLQKMAGRTLSADERDEIRGQLGRQRMAKVNLLAGQA